jgi:uncharacterized protein (TIGR00369 family)
MAIWVSPATLDEIAVHSRRTASEHFGITFTGIGDDWLEASMPLDDRTLDPDGQSHEGALAIVAETIASVGANLCVDTPRRACLGQMLHVACPQPASLGPVTARATPLTIHPDSQLWEVRIRDRAGILVCVAHLTVATIDRPPGPPR